MKTVTPALANHLGQSTTGLCRLLKITRNDGTIYRYTDFDQTLTFTESTTSITTPVNLCASLTGWSSPTPPQEYVVVGSLTGVTEFTGGETAVQTGTGASGTVCNQLPGAYIDSYWGIYPGPLVFFSPVTGTPDATHTWVGQTSGAVFTPTDLPRVSLWVSSAHPHINGGFVGTMSFDMIFQTTTTGNQNWFVIQFGNDVNGNGPALVLYQNYGSNQCGFTLTTGWSPWVGPTIGTNNPTITKNVWHTIKIILDGAGNASWYLDNVLQSTANVGEPTQGTYIGFTDLYGNNWLSNLDITVVTTVTANVGTYLALDGLTFKAVQHKSDASPNNTQVTGFITDGGINENDIRTRLYDNAIFELRAVNWQDLTMGDMKMLSGPLGDIQVKNGEYQIELRGWTQKLTSQIGSTYGPVCRAELFGGGIEGINPTSHWKCQLNRADWVQTGTVGSSPDEFTILPPTAGSPPEVALYMIGSATPTELAPAGWFNDGIITYTSGVLNGYTFQIANWDGTTLTLFSGTPMPQQPAAGETYEIEPGCDKTRPTCHSRFNNAINFAGEADIPGLGILGQCSYSIISE